MRIQFLDGHLGPATGEPLFAAGPTFPFVKSVEINAKENVLSKINFDPKKMSPASLIAYNGTSLTDSAIVIPYSDGYSIGDYIFGSYVVTSVLDIDSIKEFETLAEMTSAIHGESSGVVNTLVTLWSVTRASPYLSKNRDDVRELKENRGLLVESAFKEPSGSMSTQLKALKFTSFVLPMINRLLGESVVHNVAGRLPEEPSAVEVETALEEIDEYLLSKRLNNNQRLLATSLLELGSRAATPHITTIGEAITPELINVMDIETVMEVAIRIWLTK